MASNNYIYEIFTSFEKNFEILDRKRWNFFHQNFILHSKQDFHVSMQKFWNFGSKILHFSKAPTHWKFFCKRHFWRLTKWSKSLQKNRKFPIISEFSLSPANRNPYDIKILKIFNDSLRISAVFDRNFDFFRAMT